MNTVQRIALAVVVPAVFLICVWVRQGHFAINPWWTWIAAIVSVCVFEWWWWEGDEREGG